MVTDADWRERVARRVSECDVPVGALNRRVAVGLGSSRDIVRWGARHLARRSSSPVVAAALVEQLWPLGAVSDAARPVLARMPDAALLGLGPSSLEPLCAFLDAEPTAPGICTRRLRQTLRELRRADSRELLCYYAVRRGSASALEAALEAALRPNESTTRAVLLFLGADEQAYDDVDPDGSLLRAARNLDGTLRRRIAERARSTGRLVWLRDATGSGLDLAGTDVAGDLDSDRAVAGRAAWTDAEWEATIEVLTGTRRWSALWSLVGRSPPRQAARLLGRLAASSWRPDDPVAAASVDALVALAARCRSPIVGSVFRPVASWSEDKWLLGLTSLAVGGGFVATLSRHLGAYRRHIEVSRIPDDGRRPTIRPAFAAEHLTMTGDGLLVVAGVRTGGHAGPHGVVQVWRLPTGRTGGPVHCGRVRGLAVSPHGRMVAVLETHRIVLRSLPGLEEIRRVSEHPEADGGRIDQVAFSPDGWLIALRHLAPTGGRSRVEACDPRSGPLRTQVEMPRAGNEVWAVTDDAVLVSALDRSHELPRFPRIRVVSWSRRSPDVWLPESTSAQSVSASPDGRLAVGVVVGRLSVWALPDGREVRAGSGVDLSHGRVGVGGSDAAVAGFGWDGALAVARPWSTTVQRPEAAILAETPVDRIDAADLERVRGRTHDPPTIAWLDLIEALVADRRRYDVVVEPADPGAGPSDRDIDVDPCR